MKLQGIISPTAIFNKTINQLGGMFIPVSQHIIQRHSFPRHEQIMNCSLNQEEDEAHLATTSIKMESTKQKNITQGKTGEQNRLNICINIHT